MHIIKRAVPAASLFILALCWGLECFGQSLLNKTVTVECKKKRLIEVLDAIEKQGHFYFSYNSNIIRKDSVVSLSVKNETVKRSLDLLLGENYQYKETEHHIIILPLDKEKWYTVSGYITDAVTGQRIPDASVFERQQLVATLTDPTGYFKLRLRDRGRLAATQITVSKGFYMDTSIAIDKGYDQEVTLSIAPAEHALPDIVITQYTKMEQTWLGKLLVSNTIRKTSANLERFFVDKPIQLSLLPGLGTHGQMASQVTNTFSFNVLGGYSAGVDGLELGGLFNIDKKDVRYAQVGGIFNVVSGNVTGVQVGGVSNTVLKTVEGAQIGGIANAVGGSMNGLQVSGIAGHVSDSVEGVVISGISSSVGGRVSGAQISGICNLVFNKDTTDVTNDSIPDAMHGLQIAGIVNVVNGHTRGAQLSGVANLNRGDVHGVQMSGFFNIARRVQGSQISVINVADTVTGLCFGILNIVKHGYHILSLSSNEMMNMNAVYKAGSSRLYSILGGGMNYSEQDRIYALTYGIGTTIPLGKRLGISMEGTSNHLYPSSQELNITIVRFEPTLRLKLHKWVSLYAGPAIAFCPATEGIIGDYFPNTTPANALHSFESIGNTAAWIGWKAGIDIF